MQSEYECSLRMSNWSEVRHVTLCLTLLRVPCLNYSGRDRKSAFDYFSSALSSWTRVARSEKILLYFVLLNDFTEYSGEPAILFEL